MTSSSQTPSVDTTYLVQTATALQDENVTVTSAQLAWAIGVGGQAVSTEELPNWGDRGRLAVLALAGASPAVLLGEIAFLVEQAASAGTAASAASAQASPYSGILNGQQPPVPGAASAAQPTAPVPGPPGKKPVRSSGGRRQA